MKYVMLALLVTGAFASIALFANDYVLLVSLISLIDVPLQAWFEFSLLYSLPNVNTFLYICCSNVGIALTKGHDQLQENTSRRFPKKFTVSHLFHFVV